MADKLGLGDRYEAQVLSPPKDMGNYFELPYFAAHAELHPAVGAPYRGWTADMSHNVVQSLAKTWALNKLFGFTAINTAMNTWYVGLHSNAGTDTTFTGPNALTSAEISGYTTAAGTSTWRHSVSFNSNMAQQTTTFGLTYVFHAAGQQTVSGPWILGGTTNATAGQATGNGGTAGAVLYACGAFNGGAKTVNSNDTLQVTVTLSVA